MSQVFSLADLDQWPRTVGTHLAVLGHPIKHSISPAMHNAALEEMRKVHPALAGWQYHRFEVRPEELPEALPRFLDAGFLGLNLTLPHKVLAFPLCAELSFAARPIGAVNTLRADVLHTSAGAILRTKGWTGFNTDGPGLSDAIAQDLGLRLARAPVLLLGAGGAARAAAVQCLQERCASLTIVNRSIEKLNTLLGDLAPLSLVTELKGFASGSEDFTLPDGAIVINATSAGLRPEDPLPVDLAALPRPAAVYDMIYNPTETRLLAAARRLGIPAANGLSMLVNQGARALEHWTGLPVPVATMDAAARRALS